MRKGIIIALAVLVLFAISWAGDKLFFEDWNIKASAIRSDGLAQATLVNPDGNGNIKSVVVLVSPEDVLAYWYFDEFGNPYLFEMEDGNYVRRPDKEKNCIECHRDKAKTSL